LTPEIKPKHWVHIRDTTDAVSLLVMADTDAFAQGVIDLCGRRAWTPDAVISEINLYGIDLLMLSQILIQ